MKVAALQFSPVKNDVNFNSNRINYLLENINSDLIVLPELASTGYFYINKEELYTISENPENSDYCLMIRSLSEKKVM